MNKNKRPKKILFSEQIDSAINGYALAFSFLGIGAFLFLRPNYFFAPIVSYILGAFLGIIGVLGTGIELSKSAKIKGMDNLALGLILLVVWLVTYTKISANWSNILFFPLLVFGAYAVCLGLIQGGYSIVSNTKSSRASNEEGHSKGSAIGQIILFLTQICGLIIAILNVIKAVNT